MDNVKILLVLVNTIFIKLKNCINQRNIISIYKYVSWFLTSVLYLFDEPRATIGFKLIVITSLFIAGKITLNIYLKYSNSPKILKNIIFIETLGIILLLIPTGGIKSPFLWYALSPVLASAIYLTSYFCWINLFVYIVSAIIISYKIFEKGIGIKELVINNSSYFIVFILITFSVRLYSNMVQILNKQRQELLDTNIKLKISNERVNRTNENIKSLYQAVEALTAQDTPESYMQTFAEYGAKLTGTRLCFFWLSEFKSSRSSIKLSSHKENLQELLKEINNLKTKIKRINEPIVVKLINKEYLVSVIGSSTKYYGIIGIEIDTEYKIGQPIKGIDELLFLSDLSSVVLERFHLEQIVDKLIIIDEQNRIANEMHDNVLQRLFSISCAIHTMESKANSIQRPELFKQLKLVKESLNSVSQELRYCIYGLSGKKNEAKNYINTLRKYLIDFSEMNMVKTDIAIHSKSEIFAGELKKAIFRIVQEACSNAFRHGKCTKIKVNMSIDNKYVQLSINDNGRGFSLKKVKADRSKGLGLSNMQNLVNKFNGDINIVSNVRGGTELIVCIPNTNDTLIKMERCFK